MRKAMNNSPNEFQVKKSWQQFLKTPEASELKTTKKNSDLLHREVLAGDLDYSCQALQLAARTLRDALDLKPVATVTQTKVAPQPELTQAELDSQDPHFPVKLPSESGWSFERRASEYRAIKQRELEYQQRHQPQIWKPNPAQVIEQNMARAVMAARRQNYMRETKS
jgi:hypothetical protein